MPNEIISRTIAIDDFDVKRDRQGRTVTAYAAVFGQPTEVRDQHGHYHEEIGRTSFNRTLSHGIDRVHVHYNHGYDLSGRPNGLLAVPVATPTEIKPDGKGLLTISRYNDGELADAILAAWEGGQIRGQSFRGRVHQSREIGTKGGIPHIERTELGLREYGPTHSPAYEGAGLVAIRSQDDLAELVRSMITDMIRHPEGSPDQSSITPDLGPDASGQAAASLRERRRRLSIARRAQELGVTRDATQP